MSLATLGILLSANRLIRLVSNPVVGGLADHVSRRRLVLIGLGTGVVSTLLYTAPGGFVTFLIGRLLWGISWSLIYIGVYRMVLDVTDGSDRGWGSGILQTFYFVGLAANPLLGSLLSGWVGFHAALLLCAALQGLGLTGAVVFLPDTRTTDAPDTRQQRSAAAVSWRSWLAASFDLLRNREILAGNALYLLTLFIGDGIIMSTITLYLKQRLGEEVSLLGWLVPVAAGGGALLTLRAVLSALAAPLGGHWSDRPGLRWPVVLAGTLVTAVGCGVLGLDGGAGWIVIGIALAALGSSVIMTVVPAVVSSAADRRHSGLAMGLLTNAGDLGCAIAPLISYTLLAGLPLSTLYLISGGLFILGLAWGGLAARKRTEAPLARVQEERP